jgi:hypothetical protein
MSLLLIARPGIVVEAPPDEYTTSFPLTENPIDEGGVWNSPDDTGFTNVQTSGGRAFGTSAGIPGADYDDSYAYLTGFGADYEIEAVIQRGTVPSGNHEVELHVRHSESGGAVTSIEVLFPAAGGFQVMHWNSWVGGTGSSAGVTEITGGGTGPGHSAEPEDDDVVLFRVVGQVLTIEYNSVEIWTDTYSSIPAAGNPAIGFFYRTADGADPTTFGFKSVTVRLL